MCRSRFVIQFVLLTQMLNILERFVISQGYVYLKMDGGTSVRARQPMIKKFNEVRSLWVECDLRASSHCTLNGHSIQIKA